MPRPSPWVAGVSSGVGTGALASRRACFHVGLGGEVGLRVGRRGCGVLVCCLCFNLISFCGEFAEWLLARSLNTKRCLHLCSGRGGVSLGSQAGPACVGAFGEPGLAAPSPCPLPLPVVVTGVEFGSLVSAVTPAAELVLVCSSHHWDPGLCISFSPRGPPPGLVRLTLHPLCPCGILRGPSEERVPTLRSSGACGRA